MSGTLSTAHPPQKKKNICILDQKQAENTAVTSVFSSIIMFSKAPILGCFSIGFSQNNENKRCLCKGLNAFSS